MNDLKFPFTFCCRTYQNELITWDEKSNVSKDYVRTHLATFERSILFNGQNYKKYYVASCVTFMSGERVPAGMYNVGKIF